MTRSATTDIAARPRIVSRTERGRRDARSSVATGAPSRPARPRRAQEPRANEQEGRQPTSPIKETTWKWYIPIYFWLGGIAAGSWLAVAAEDLTGENDRDVVRAGRYLSLGSVLAGTTLLVLDLGRRDRFLNMLRIVRPRSTMSLGSWGLTGFGTFTGAAALLQAAEDGWLGSSPRLERLSRGWLGRVIHVTGLPAALFVGSYTGVLLASTSTPSWARRTRVLGPLFLASGVASGFAALSGVLEATHGAGDAAHRRLARADAVALAAELVLGALSHAQARSLPSARHEPAWQTMLRRFAMGAGMVGPLALRFASGLSTRRPRDRRVRSELAAVGATLAGSLALRYLVTHEGRRSARTADDTWAFAALSGRAQPVALGRGQQIAQEVRRRPARLRHRPAGGELVGHITVAQEDRIRVVDNSGRGYLFTVKKRRASLGDLERWRDAHTPVWLQYRGIPDAGATVERIRAAED